MRRKKLKAQHFSKKCTIECVFPLKVVNVTGTTILLQHTVNPADPSRRPWYMRGGARRPYPAVRSNRTGRRLAHLWPEEDAYDDRSCH